MPTIAQKAVAEINPPEHRTLIDGSNISQEGVVTEKDIRTSVWLLWAGIAVLIAGGVAAHFPPPAGTASVANVVAFYKANANGMNLYAIAQIASVTLVLPVYCAIAEIIRKSDESSNYFSSVYLVGSIFAVVIPLMCAFFFAVGAFRPNTSPEIVQNMNDIGFMFLILGAPPALVQAAALGAAIRRDSSPKPFFPRWLVPVNWIYAVGSMFGMLAPFYNSGALSRDGLVGGLTPYIALIVWLGGTTISLLNYKVPLNHSSNA